MKDDADLAPPGVAVLEDVKMKVSIIIPQAQSSYLLNLLETAIERHHSIDFELSAFVVAMIHASILLLY